MADPVQTAEQHIPAPISDQRLVKGARARASIARHAADVASVEGLTGLSLGRLASDLGISKSGVATLFGTKEKLQLAAVDAAREIFIEYVVAPASTAPRGIERLRAYMRHWFDYIDTPVLPGGCFQVAGMAEFDSRPGPVHDALAASRAEWFTVLEREIGRAQEAGFAAAGTPHAVAFQLDALISSANTAARMGEENAIATAREIVTALLDRRAE